jgi:hypothetical protein
LITLSKRKTMDDWKKQIGESIADACVSSFMESTFPGCTISNSKVRISVRQSPNGDWSRVTYKPNPRQSTQRKLEDGVKPPPYVLTEDFPGVKPRQPRKPRKAVAAERQNWFALWRETWRNWWPDACW